MSWSICFFVLLCCYILTTYFYLFYVSYSYIFFSIISLFFLEYYIRNIIVIFALEKTKRVVSRHANIFRDRFRFILQSYESFELLNFRLTVTANVRLEVTSCFLKRCMDNHERNQSTVTHMSVRHSFFTKTQISIFIQMS